MSARDAILGALRGAPVDTARLDAEAAALVASIERPAVDPTALRSAFLDRLAQPGLGATEAPIADFAALPAAVAFYMAEHDLPRALYLPPDPRLMAADWRDFDVRPSTAPDEAVVIAVARCGVAETGSLVLETGPDAPMLPNFLGLHHLVVVPRIVAYLEDALRDHPAPRAHYWITGVSGTTDIEGSYVRGAHGPRFLHVLPLDGA